jgi:hypothetical protein
VLRDFKSYFCTFAHTFPYKNYKEPDSAYMAAMAYSEAEAGPAQTPQFRVSLALAFILHSHRFFHYLALCSLLKSIKNTPPKIVSSNRCYRKNRDDNNIVAYRQWQLQIPSDRCLYAPRKNKCRASVCYTF